MTAHPSDRPDGARPSVAEIVALTRPLGELTTPGREVNPGERAAFLADKDAVIARIAAPHAATDTDAAAGRELHQHVARIGRTDHAPQLASWMSAPEVESVPEMPEWMREQARRTEAAIADGTYVPGPPDDLARFVDRLAALRGLTAEDDPERRVQLAHWHTDDGTLDADDVHEESGGPRTVMDDGPGLP